MNSVTFLTIESIKSIDDRNFLNSFAVFGSFDLLGCMMRDEYNCTIVELGQSRLKMPNLEKCFSEIIST